MSRRHVMIVLLSALALPAAARAEDASLGGMLKGLHCTTAFTGYSYSIDGQARMMAAANGPAGRGYTLDMGHGTICSGESCANAIPFTVTAVTNRVSYKEVRFVADVTEYRVSMTDASVDGAPISLEVIRSPQSKGSSRQTGACERT